MIFIETPSGDRLLVESLDGCDGATVIAENIEPPTDPAAMWDGTAFTVPLDVLKARKRGEVDQYLGAQFYGGFTPSSGPLAGHTLQTRDNTDRTNWLTSQAAYQAAIAGGAGATSGAAFRTADNLTITCTYQEGYDALMAMADWGKALMGKSWALKDEIAGLTTAADVQSYDVAAKWAALA